MVRWEKEAGTERKIEKSMKKIMTALNGLMKEIYQSVKYAILLLLCTTLLHIMKMGLVIVVAYSRRGEVLNES